MIAQCLSAKEPGLSLKDLLGFFILRGWVGLVLL